MHTTTEAPGLRLCRLSPSEGPIREFWEASGSHMTGLRCHIGTYDDDACLFVFTGGYLAKRFVPRDTNAPTSVNARVRVGEQLEVISLSATFDFGEQGSPGPAEMETIRAAVIEFCELVITRSAAFPLIWHAACAARIDKISNRDQARWEKRLSVAATQIAAQIAEQAGHAATLDIKELANDAHVTALAELVVGPKPDTAPEEGGDPVGPTLRRLSTEAAANVKAAQRLSEAEFIALATDTVLAEVPATVDPVVVRQIIGATYDVMYDVHYGSGNFPDRISCDRRHA